MALSPAVCLLHFLLFYLHAKNKSSDGQKAWKLSESCGKKEGQNGRASDPS